MSARADILAKLKRGRAATAGYVQVADEFTEQTNAEALTRFTELALENLCTVARTSQPDEVPAEVSRYLAELGVKQPVMLDCKLPVAAELWAAAGLETMPTPVHPDGIQDPILLRSTPFAHDVFFPRARKKKE